MDKKGPTRRDTLGLLASGLLPATAQAKAPPTQVDLALVLAIDCSYSVDTYEYQQQMRGTGQAFLDSMILDAVSRGALKKVAVSAFLWSDTKMQYVIVPWHLLAKGADAIEIADTFLRAPRNIPAETTATGQALLFAKSLLDSAPPAFRRVVDISTDGRCNAGIAAKVARDQLLVDDITINGLAIETDGVKLEQYLKDEVIGGQGSFVITATDYNAYGAAIKKKLFKEITNSDLT